MKEAYTQLDQPDLAQDVPAFTISTFPMGRQYLSTKMPLFLTKSGILLA
jgi:hypothetical protein